MTSLTSAFIHVARYQFPTHYLLCYLIQWDKKDYLYLVSPDIALCGWLGSKHKLTVWSSLLFVLCQRSNITNEAINKSQFNDIYQRQKCACTTWHSHSTTTGHYQPISQHTHSHTHTHTFFSSQLSDCGWGRVSGAHQEHCSWKPKVKHNWSQLPHGWMTVRCQALHLPWDFSRVKVCADT